MSQGNAVATLLSAHEKAILDFKEEYDLADLTKNDTRFEIAKDMAAFANHIGGTILVGAIENRATGRVGAFKNVNAPPYLVKAIDRAGVFCLPHPIATHEQIELDIADQNAILRRSDSVGRITLVAINVRPYLNGPVGTKVWDKSGGKGHTFEGAFRFWRRGT